jgi:hypothetical protein
MKGALSGPATVTLTVTSARGPTAANRVGPIPPVVVQLVNTGSDAIAVKSIRVDPLRESDAGIRASGQLVVQTPGREDGFSLGGGDVLDLVISGTVPERARSYASTLRVLTDGGEALSIPVVVQVATHTAWGVACMMLGLLVVGVIHALDAQSGIQNKIGELLLLEQQTHEFLEKHAPAESLVPTERAFDEDVAAALEALRRRRSVGIHDRRTEDADARLKSAESEAQELRKAEKGKRPGQTEVDALESEWASFEARMNDIGDATPLLFAESPHLGMPLLLRDFFVSLRRVYLVDTMKIVADELASQITRVRLLYQSGAGEPARAQAVTVRRWLRRASHEAQEREQLVAATAVRVRRIASDDAWIRRRLAAENLPSPVAVQTLSLLDQAASALRGPSALSTLKNTSMLLERAHTEIVRAEAESTKARAAQALKASDAETSVSDVLRMLDDATQSTDRSPSTKAANLERMMAAWRTHMEAIADEAERRALLAHVDAVLAHVRGGDFEGAVGDNHAIWDGWTAYSKRRSAEAVTAATAPTCDLWRLELRQRMDDTERSMRLLGQRPELLDWDRRLGQLRQEQLTLRSDQCMDGVVALDAREADLDHEVFAAALADAGIPPDVRLETALQSGVAEAIEVSRRLSFESRSLSVSTRTPKTDWYVDRAIAFSIGDLDPSWQQGVLVRIDFGDDTPPVTIDAEQLKRDAGLTHSFANGGRYRVVVQAAEGFVPEPVGSRLLGEGEVEISAASSPISQAHTLEDEFLNFRFFIALVIASGVYYWRFHTKNRLFGARGIDYIEAFALGATVSAALDNLPAALEKAFSG